MSKIAIPAPSAATDGPRLEDRLREAGHEIVVTDRWTDDELGRIFGDVDVVVASPARTYPAELFSKAPRLRLITSPVIGVDTIDLDAASEFGVLVANCPTAENIIGVAGAALDVFQTEPIDMGNPLLRCDPDRMILTPHSIGHNLETGPTGLQMAFENIDRALRGELPESVINQEVIPAWRRRLAMF